MEGLGSNDFILGASEEDKSQKCDIDAYAMPPYIASGREVDGRKGGTDHVTTGYATELSCVQTLIRK
ncbi:hypothetical protein E4U38_003546, partial [Claviceps purpurea]